MNKAQYKDHVSHVCLSAAVVASWSLTQEVAGSSPFTIMTGGGVRGCTGGGMACVVARGGRAWLHGGVHGCMGVWGVCGFIWGACMVLFRGACMVLLGGVVLFTGGRAWFFQFFRIQ